MIFPIMLVLICFGASHNLSAAESISATQPNIVFVFSDDHAVQAIGAYGSKVNETPSIDRLAKSGVTFQNSFCANSICGPSRACILTGLHSHRNGLLRNGDRFDGSQTTFPPLLQAAGYQTALIGKWHLGTTPVGFDYWEILPGQGHYYNPDFLLMDGSKEQREGYCTDIITEQSLQWLKERRNSKQPFLLMCQHKAPHRSWAPAPRHFKLYKDVEIPEPATLRDNYADRSSLLAENEMTIRDHMIWGHDMKFHGQNLFPKHFAEGWPCDEYPRMTTAQREAWDAHYEPLNAAFIAKVRAGELTDDEILSWKYQRYIKNYLRCIAAVDESVGKLLDYLDASGLSDNTVFIYSSDQGFYLGEHGWYDKRWMFEESFRMPLIMRAPGLTSPGVQSKALVQNIDYAPTFLELAGVDIPPGRQGRSIVPVLKSGATTPDGWRDAVYYAYYENDAVHQVAAHDGVRTDRYKLIYFPRSREWQLFDLEKDPEELRSMHDDAAYAKILQGMQKRYRDLRKLCGVHSAVIPLSRGDEAWWSDRFRGKLAESKQQPCELLFIGDSITQGWEDNGKSHWEEHFAPRGALNMGFSGDRTEHVIWRLEQGDLSHLNPSVTVLMIGTNNTGHTMQDPTEVALGIQKIIELVRQQLPKTEILVQGVFPRGRTPMAEDRLNNIAINEAVRQIVEEWPKGARIHFDDIGDAFVEADGLISSQIMHDALHLSPEGYAIWAQALLPKIEELEKRSSTP